MDLGDKGRASRLDGGGLLSSSLLVMRRHVAFCYFSLKTHSDVSHTTPPVTSATVQLKNTNKCIDSYSYSLFYFLWLSCLSGQNVSMVKQKTDNRRRCTILAALSCVFVFLPLLSISCVGFATDWCSPAAAVSAGTQTP